MAQLKAASLLDNLSNVRGKGGIIDILERVLELQSKAITQSQKNGTVWVDREVRCPIMRLVDHADFCVSLTLWSANRARSIATSQGTSRSILSQIGIEARDGA